MQRQWATSVPGHPVNYGAPVEYADAAVMEFHTWPVVGGVYLLTENGRYYVGQSVDVAGRFASHRLNPVNCKLMEPRCALLAGVSERQAPRNQSAHKRLIAEARFIAAALSMRLPLNNALTPYKRAKLLSQFPDVSRELARIAQALQMLREAQ